jgi:hypothetical protein
MRERNGRKFVFVLFKFLERLVSGRNEGLAEATLRLPADHGNHEAALFDALEELYEIYGPGYFDVTVTANAILQSNRDRRFGIFYGQDFGADGRGNLFSMGPAESVSDLSEVSGLSTRWDQGDFEDMFFRTFTDTDTSVHSLVNFVYLIRRHLGDFEAQMVVGSTFQTLY